MKQIIRICFVALLALTLVQVAGAQWQCLYVTLDIEADGNFTGDRTTGVGVIKEDMFVAMCTKLASYSYMIPYVNADSLLGRKYTYGYGTSGVYEVWTDGGFDQVTFLNAWTIKARPDSLVYIANNDADHNVLVYKYAKDTLSVVAPFPRQQTGANGIYGLDVDNNGCLRVYRYDSRSDGGPESLSSDKHLDTGRARGCAHYHHQSPGWRVQGDSSKCKRQCDFHFRLQKPKSHQVHGNAGNGIHACSGILL